MTTLKRGDRDRDGATAVARLQCLLNRVGGLLGLDGDFGAGTEHVVRFAQRLAGQPETGKADRRLMDFLEAQPEPSELISADGLTLIGRFEVGDLRAYDRRFLHPIKPSVDSGITIGVGYDLRFNSRATFEADWGGVLPAAAVTRLTAFCERAGSKADVTALADLEVPWPAAWQVFCRTTVPAYYAMARKVFPSIDGLPEHRRSVLVSLIYNRGASMKNSDGRKEMRAIRDLLAAARPEPVATELEKMKRLWDGDPLNGGTTERLPGLLIRRDEEAAIWRHGFQPGSATLL